MSDAALLSPPSLRLVQRERELRAAVAEARALGKSVGLVPTMGALHEGHLSLVRASVAEGNFTVATIFVNPTQFGPAEDFARYPRNVARDCELLATAGAELAFLPETAEIYPPGFSTYVEPPAVALPLEGKCRPGHFRGVATVVLKLFNLAGADVAFFGHKDYQQSLVIRRLVADLNVPIEIRVCPTVREPDGLALSSRNAYLSPVERMQAAALSRSLFAARDLAEKGEHRSGSILAEMKRIVSEAGVERIDYLAIADPQTLADVTDVSREAIALVAAHVGKTRLIDNLRIGG